MYKVLDNNERLFQIKFLTGTRKTVLINEKSCREVPDKECDGVLFELCCAVNATEAKGHIVTSVVELCEDGSTPRVAFRNTKEYRAAKQVQDSVSTPTCSIRVWCSGHEIKTRSMGSYYVLNKHYLTVNKDDMVATYPYPFSCDDGANTLLEAKDTDILTPVERLFLWTEHKNPNPIETKKK